MRGTEVGGRGLAMGEAERFGGDFWGVWFHTWEELQLRLGVLHIHAHVHAEAGRDVGRGLDAHLQRALAGEVPNC